MMKNSVILEVTNDDYEFIVDFFESTREASCKLNRSEAAIQSSINRPPKTKRNKTKLIRVWLDKGEEYEK